MFFWFWSVCAFLHFYYTVMYCDESILYYFVPVTRMVSTLILYYLYLEHYDYSIICGYFEFLAKMSMLVFIVYYTAIHHTIELRNQIEQAQTHWIHGCVFILMMCKASTYDYQLCPVDLLPIFNTLFVMIVFTHCVVSRSRNKNIYPFLDWVSHPFTALMTCGVIYLGFLMMNMMFDMYFKKN